MVAEPSLVITPPALIQQPWPRWCLVLLALMLVGVCVLLYGRTLDYPMVFDDHQYLINNPLAQNATSFSWFTHLREFANRPAQLGLDPDLATNFVLRPVAYATFYANWCFDTFRPHWYRVVNIGIHAANVLLIAALFSLLLRRMGVEQRTRTFISVTAALLFAVHPLAIESVTYIVQRFTLLATMFYLGSLLLYFAADGIESKTRRVLLRASAVLVLLLGMLSKECTITAPVIAVLIDIGLLRTPWRAALKKGLPLLLCLPLIPLLLALVAWAQRPDGFGLQSVVNIVNSKDQPWNHAEYLITQLTVVQEYLRMLVWPTNLNLDPSWPLHRSLLDGPVMLALAMDVALLGIAVWLFRRRGTVALHALPLACLAWFFVTILPSSGAAPLPDLMAEHRSYLPSVGICVVAAWLLHLLGNALRRLPYAAPAAVLACALALGAVNWQRNDVWRSDLTLWQDTAAKSPDKFRVWGNLGVAYFGRGDYDHALECNRRALEIEPRFEGAFINLINCYNAQHRFSETVREVSLAVRARPGVAQSIQVQYLFAIALINVNHLDEGLKVLHGIVTDHPEYYHAHAALGMAYRQLNQNERALRHLRTAQKFNPTNEALSRLVAECEAGQTTASR
jgi:Flp pilus assembly protein TadD